MSGENRVKLSERIYERAKALWPRYLTHPFVTEMADGTLPKEKFRYYMVQDYLYLRDYVKIFAAILQKTDDFEQIRFLSGEMANTINETFRTHLPYMKRLGVTEEEIADARPHIDNSAYSHYMLCEAQAGDVLTGLVTLLNCSWSYAYIAEQMVERYPSALHDENYGAWFAGYVSEEYRQTNQALIDRIDALAEVIDEMQVEHDAIGITPVGCAVLAYDYVDIDWVQAAHGRAAAVATAIKRLNPSKLVFTYQGDGDLAAIGTGETIHACNRGENITIIYVNNAIYGMTGGQMAPTTLLGMKTVTTPEGRDPQLHGYPFKVADMLAHLDGVCYLTRQSVHTPGAVRKAKKALRKAFENSMQRKGLSFVEFVATCNSGWKMSPTEANRWMEQNMLPLYPLGDIKG